MAGNNSSAGKMTLLLQESGRGPANLGQGFHSLRRDMGHPKASPRHHHQPVFQRYRFQNTWTSYRLSHSFYRSFFTGRRPVRFSRTAAAYPSLAAQAAIYEYILEIVRAHG